MANNINFGADAPAAYGMISLNGKRYSVTYFRNEATGATGNRSGYDKSVFNECPEDMPIIDFRGADMSFVLDFLLGAWAPRECAAIVGEENPTLQEYIQAAAAVPGAKIITINNL